MNNIFLAASTEEKMVIAAIIISDLADASPEEGKKRLVNKAAEAEGACHMWSVEGDAVNALRLFSDALGVHQKDEWKLPFCAPYADRWAQIVLSAETKAKAVETNAEPTQMWCDTMQRYLAETADAEKTEKAMIDAVIEITCDKIVPKMGKEDLAEQEHMELAIRQTAEVMKTEKIVNAVIEIAEVVAVVIKNEATIQREIQLKAIEARFAKMNPVKHKKQPVLQNQVTTCPLNDFRAWD